MFYYLDGELVLCDANAAVIDCGGVGYQLTVSMTTAESINGKTGEKCRLYTHLQVKEDGVELFGFATREELSAFRLLISVSGVGPKAAMSILSLLSPDRFAYAVATEDTKALSRAPGVGGKTAARIVLELKDKLSKDQLTGSLSSMEGGKKASAPLPSGGKLGEAADALSVLGYSRAEINDVLRGIDVSGLSLEQIITASLRLFSEKG